MSPRLLESIFWALPPDSEHSSNTRAAAWTALKELDCNCWASPVDWYLGLIRYLRDGSHRPCVVKLSHAWSLPELFERPEPHEHEHEYVEIHAHFRGSVPYLVLWKGWLKNARWRAQLRTIKFEDGHWYKTGAQLLEEATEIRARFPRWISEPEEYFVFRLTTLPSRLRRARKLAARYLAICTTLRRRLLHQRLKAGLVEFDSKYRLYSHVQKIPAVSERQQVRRMIVAVLRRFEEEGATTVELRPTLEHTRRDLNVKLGSVVDGYFEYLDEACSDRTRKPARFGLVPSLVKQEAVPRAPDLHRDHWSRQQAVWCRQMDLLLATLRDTPVLRYFVVGIDVAGQELGCPPRVLAAPIQRVHEYNAAHGVADVAPGRTMPDPRILCAHQAQIRNESCLPARLGVTVHLGEDFVDPLTGLRHIAEGIESLGLRAGDRLGHGLVLALDERRLEAMLQRRAGTPGVRQLDNGQYEVYKPRGEHLLDLAWVARRTSDHTLRAIAGARLSETAAAMFGVPAGPHRLASVLDTRPDVLLDVPAARYADPSCVSPHDCVWVPLDSLWRKLFEQLRRQLVQLIALRELVVESCPTSNRVVANLEEPPIVALLEQPGLQVAIATDDPAVFGSWPAQELELVKRHVGEAGVQRLLRVNAGASFVH